MEARRKFKQGEVNFKKLNKLPGKTISLAATIQYLDLVPKVKTYLEKQGKRVIIKKGASHKAHVIGCNSQAFDKNADTLLLLADGKFHALNNALQLNKEIYIFNTHSLDKLANPEIENYKQKTKAKINLFLHADKIGILTSTKHGQKPNQTQLKNLKQKLQKADKQVYIFEADTINPQELENFPSIKIWLNTACYGLALDSPRILNVQDVLNFI